jgi:hypothetical protein
MSPFLKDIFNSVWGAVMVAESGLLLLIVVRKAYKDYPAFSSFVAFCVARSFLLLFFREAHPGLYVMAKWLAYVPQVAILLAVVLEVLYLLFHPFEALPKNTVTHFLEAIGVVVAFAVTFAVLHPGAQSTAWATFARATDQAVSWVLCGVFILVALFSVYFGIPWRHRVYGIGLGFLLYLGVDVVVTTATAQFRLAPLSPIGLLDMVAFLVSCLIWGYYFYAPEVARTAPDAEQLEEIREIVAGFAKLLPAKER